MSLARDHASSLAFLAVSLRDAKRAREALAPARGGLAVFESLKVQIPADYYNMACACAIVSALNEEASLADREQLEARAVRYLRIAIAATRRHSCRKWLRNANSIRSESAPISGRLWPTRLSHSIHSLARDDLALRSDDTPGRAMASGGGAPLSQPRRRAQGPRERAGIDGGARGA